MADKNFRGVVIGSTWRLGIRLFKAGTYPPDRPHQVHYVQQPWELGPLVRRALLYFDQIAVPTNNVLPQGETPDFDHLVDQGVLVREQVNLSMDPIWIDRLRQLTQAPNMGLPGHIAEPIAMVNRQVFLQLEKDQPGAWDFANVGKGLDFQNDETVRGYSIQLYNLLPVPGDLVPYEDVIDFKKRERSALLDLRAALDQAYCRIANSTDPAFVASFEIRELGKAIQDVHSLLSRARIPFGLPSVTIEWNPFLWVGAALTGVDLAERLEKIGLDFPLPQIVGGGLAAGMLIKRSDFQTPTKRAGASRYIYEAAKIEIIDLKREFET
jgi:hypothetical protein